MARSKSHAGKLNVRLPRSLNTELRTWIQEVADRHPYFGRRLGVEPCVGALVEALVAMPPDEREEMIAAWLPRLEARERSEMEPTAESKLSVGSAGEADSTAAAPRSSVTRYSREFPDSPEDPGNGLDGDDPPARKGRKAPTRKRGS